MKERILTQLYGIWKGAPSSEAYLERIKNYKLKIKEEGGDRLTDGDSSTGRHGTAIHAA